MFCMKRRKFIALIAGATVAWPLAARAQQPGKLATIGFLGPTNLTAVTPWLTAFVQRLRERGWIEGRTVAIEYRWAEGRSERFAEIATELVGLNVDVIVTHGTGAYPAKQATATIPIVFALATDPVSAGLVASLGRPGGNVTGLSTQGTDLAGKRLELLREIIPGLRRLAIMGDAGGPGTVLEMHEVEAMAHTLGLEPVRFEFQGPEDIAIAFETFKGRADAVYVAADPFVFANRVRINTLALGARMPTIYNFREYVEADGLMSYGPSITDMFRRTADIVDKILRGAKPADIPVEQPTKFELVINLKTAKAMGLEILPTLLARADEVIE